MAGRAPSDFLVYDPIVTGHEAEPEEPIPGWRKPIALAGWGILIAILIALIVWGIIQLAEGPPPQEPTITIAPTATTTPPSSAPTAFRPPRRRSATNDHDDHHGIPEASTTDAATHDDHPTSTRSPEAYPLPQLPSVITLPTLPHCRATGATDRNHLAPGPVNRSRT